MNQLRKLNALCDVELVVDFERFPAHRVLLASCSDYFRAMFTNTVSASLFHSDSFYSIKRRT